MQCHLGEASDVFDSHQDLWLDRYVSSAHNNTDDNDVNLCDRR